MRSMSKHAVMHSVRRTLCGVDVREAGLNGLNDVVRYVLEEGRRESTVQANAAVLLHSGRRTCPFHLEPVPNTMTGI